MIAWLTAHYIDRLLTIAIAGVVVLVIAKMIRDKQNGKSSCGCGCGGCAMAGKCSKTAKKPQNNNSRV